MRRRLRFEPLEPRTLLTTITVTTTDDIFMNGDGITSLREAILQANSHPGPDEILIPAGRYRLTRDDPTTFLPDDAAVEDDLDITEDVRIVGAGFSGTVIDANGFERAFDILAGSVELTDLTITGGAATGGSLSPGPGGGIFNRASLSLTDIVIADNSSSAGGGIYNEGFLETLRTSIRDNGIIGGGSGGGIHNSPTGIVRFTSSSVSDNGGRGGGIYNVGQLEIVGGSVSRNGGSGIQNQPGARLLLHGVSVRDNSARGGAGIDNAGNMQIIGSTISGNDGSGGSGGGISNRGSAVIQASTVADNTGMAGGGISNAGVLLLVGTTIRGNDGVSGSGGGILNHGTAFISSSTISANHAFNFGGGVDNGGTMTIVNSTISGNDILFTGGGIVNTGDLTLTNTTVAENTSDPGTAGGIWNQAGTLHLTNTIVANNVASRARDIVNSATIGKVRNNLIEDPLGHTIMNGVDGNIVGADPRLGPLEDNGGPTFTHALLVGSRAIDAGHNAASGETGSFDQRGPGYPRMADGNRDGLAVMDIGAYEFQTQLRLIFDIGRRNLGIFGSDLDDRLSLQSDSFGNIVLTSNGQVVQPVDPNGQPLQIRPTVKNTSEISAWLAQGHDLFGVAGQSGWLNDIRLDIHRQATMPLISRFLSWRFMAS
jgi:hypothetical protein